MRKSLQKGSGAGITILIIVIILIIAGVLFYSNRGDDSADVEDVDTTEEVTDGDVQGDSVEVGDDADADADDADAEGDDAMDTDDEDGEATE